MTDNDRRAVVRAAAWALPVIAVAVATPLAAASTPVETKNRIRFTNVTATVGKDSNAIYANTKIQVVDGPAAVEQLMLTIAISRDGTTYSETFPMVAGWDATRKVEHVFRDVPKGGPVTVTFTAWALGVATITGQAVVTTPSWWTT